MMPFSFLFKRLLICIYGYYDQSTSKIMVYDERSLSSHQMVDDCRCCVSFHMVDGCVAWKVGSVGRVVDGI
jgi:hypothetical protein